MNDSLRDDELPAAAAPAVPAAIDSGSLWDSLDDLHRVLTFPAPRSRAEMEHLRAKLRANEHAVLYRKTGVGLAAWRALREYRERGLAVPEGILREFDSMARRLESAAGKGPLAIAAALGMTGAHGGPQGAARLHAAQRQLQIAAAVAVLQWLGVPRAQAVRRVAALHGLSAHAVRQATRRWKQQAARRRAVSGDLLTRRWR